MASTPNTTTDKITISPLTDEDVPAAFALLSASFSGPDAAPFVDAYYPDHGTPGGRALGSARLLRWMRGSGAYSVFLKATTIPSGLGEGEGKGGRGSEGEGKGRGADGGGDGETIIGFAIWTLMQHPPSPDLETAEGGPEAVTAAWPDPRDRAFMARLWSQYVGPRSRAVEKSGGRGVYVLESLAVHPEYQRLGAGSALVTWGTRAADEKGLTAIVEGTPAGRRLYEKCGFSAEIETMRFEAVGDEFDGRRVPVLTFFTREPRS